MVPNYSLLPSFILFNKIKIGTIDDKAFLTCAQFFAVELSS